jgi:hypothetical protein
MELTGREGSAAQLSFIQYSNERGIRRRSSGARVLRKLDRLLPLLAGGQTLPDGQPLQVQSDEEKATHVARRGPIVAHSSECEATQEQVQIRGRARIEFVRGLCQQSCKGMNHSVRGDKVGQTLARVCGEKLAKLTRCHHKPELEEIRSLGVRAPKRPNPDWGRHRWSRIFLPLRLEV